MSSVEPIIGIDLGTTNSVVAIIENETPHIIINAEGASKTPSTVAFLDGGDVVTGEIARRQAATIPQRTISSAKRLLGRFKQELDQEEEVYPFPLGEDNEGRVTIIVGDRAYAPEQISALVLEKLKAAAEDYLGQPVKKAIITVPAYFDDLQRHATLEAARMAGLEVPRLINEPTAAAMAYGLEKDSTETVAIYDFGGGTFDFSVLEIDQKTFEVLTTTGNSRLGGDDLDMVLLDSVADRFMKQHGIDLRSDHMTFRRLKDEVERAKCELSSSEGVVITLPFIAYKDGQPLHLEERVTREALETLIEPFVEETLNCCRSALKDARIRKNQITKVILVGGSTRIPLVQESVEDFFGMAPFRGVNPDEVVAIGAAIQGAVLNGSLEEVVLLDVTPHTLSIETKGNRKSALIEKNSTIPIRVHKTFTTTEDNQSFVNIHLLQGEEDKASENRSLGKFTLSGIPEARCGEPRIRVEIFVNADGVVEVSASESHSGKEQKLTATFSYLDHAERRARQGLSPSSNRRRRRVAASAGSDTRKRILAGAPVVQPPARPENEVQPAALPASENAPAFAEVDDSHPGLGARRRRPLAPPPAPPMPAPGLSSAVAGPPAPQHHPSRAQTEVSSRTAGALAARQAAAPQVAVAPEEPAVPEVAAAPPPPSCPMPVADCPPEFIEMVHLLVNDSADTASAAIYERDRKAFLLYCREHESDPALQALKVRLLIHGKQPEEARDAILEMRKRWPEARAEHHELYGRLCHNYPNYVSARHERATLSFEIGDLKMAMVDLEFCSKREEADTSIFDELSLVYEKILVEHEDSTLQFKLVKTYLRKGDLDNAISLLQKLVQIPAFHERATRVLGLCFWQKGLRYLAFQKFKAIPVNDEVKDILYRLATEMEENDELLHAKYALERIYEAEIGFRDTAERLKKLSYRIDLMKDDRFGGAKPPFDVSAAATMRQPRLGDRFEIIEEINRGSMGIVYKAHDDLLDEVVAVKILNDFLCADPDAVTRFKREAKSARRLTHANIVRIHDFLDLDDKKVISMEYIEGEDMKRILARNMTLTEDMVVYYVRQICEGMAYAHELGVVHRDIKPANIMINERNQVKVTDFGIAKVIDSSATRNNNGTMIMGTPLYMAPEQIQGGKIDPRADIYALGIMLYELLTGSPPFREGSIEYQHLHSPVPEIKFGASAGLKKVIYRAVEKNPDDRFQSIRELMAELPS